MTDPWDRFIGSGGEIGEPDLSERVKEIVRREMGAGPCPSTSPESGTPCGLPDLRECHDRGHERRVHEALTVSWATRLDDLERWRAAETPAATSPSR